MLYQEEESSILYHRGKYYSVNQLLRDTQHTKISIIDVKRFKPCIDIKMLDRKRIKQADLTTPIIYCHDPVWGWVVLDGAHRVAKAMTLGIATIPGKEIYHSQLIPV